MVMAKKEKCSELGCMLLPIRDGKCVHHAKQDTAAAQPKEAPQRQSSSSRQRTSSMSVGADRIGSQQAESCHACGQALPVMDLSGIDVAAAMIATGRSERQVYRWKSGDSRPDSRAQEKLRENGLL